jgi:hypothetical protein
MRRPVLVAAVFTLAAPAALPAQSTHPKFKSREIAVASFAVLPPRVTGSAKRGVEAREVTSRSEDLAKETAEILDEVLADLNWDVRDAPYAEPRLRDVQAAYDGVALRLHDRPNDVNKGAYTLGDAVAVADAGRRVDALVFSRLSAEFEEKTTTSSTPTSISFSISYLRKVHARFALVDGRSGEVLHYFEVKTNGNDETTRQALEEGILNALKRVASSVVALPVMAVEPPREDRTTPDAPKLAAWKGERVTILGTKALQCAAKGSGLKIIRRVGPEASAERLDMNAFAGRTGTVVETGTRDYQHETVVELDGGERVAVLGDRGLGFQAELDSARKLIGTSWWSRETQTMIHPEGVCEDLGSRRARLDLRRLQKVTIVDVAFGTHLQTLLLTVETEDGRRGVLDGWSGYDYLDDRYHLVEQRFGVGTSPYSSRFFLKNPRSP